MRSRNEHSDDSVYYFDWLEFAAEDLLCAKTLAEQEKCNALAAFHCQQTIEKALKGYSLYKTGRLVDGHNLPWLCRGAARQNPKFGDWLDESAAMTRLYIETRYPSDKPMIISDERLGQILKMAEDMYDFICGEVYDNESINQET